MSNSTSRAHLIYGWCCFVDSDEFTLTDLRDCCPQIRQLLLLDTVHLVLKLPH